MDIAKEPTVFERLLEPINPLLEQQAAKLPFDPKEEFHFPLFVRVLLYNFVVGYRSLRLLITGLKSAPKALGLPTVARSTLSDAFNRFPSVLFLPLLQGLLSSISFLEIPELTALGRLYCIDASWFPAVANMEWAQFKENCRAIKLHLCWELNRMLPVGFLITDGKADDRSILRQWLKEGITYIADRGYVCFELFADIVKAHAFFIIRVRKNLVYQLVEALEATMPTAAHGLFKDLTDSSVRLSNDNCYRLITFKVGATTFYILTNRIDLTTFQVITLYAYRWQVELAFRFIKRTMNGLHLISTSENGVSIQFYCLLITALLELHLKQFCVKKQDDYQQPSLPTVEKERPYEDAAAFVANIGQGLRRCWKVGVHWLLTLRNLIAHPFNAQAIALLSSA